MTTDSRRVPPADHDLFHDPLLGAVVGGCRVERFLGAGGMGAVYLGIDVALDRPVAIKVLSVGSPENVRRFIREARRQARLEHPHVVTVYGAGTEWVAGQEIHFITMRYVEGRSLVERVEQEGPLDPVEATRIVLEVARGLAYVHSEGFVHRDVKPSNILLDKEGRALLGDFGVAAREGEGGADEEEHSEGPFLGTWRWAAPEQLGGAEADQRSDWYSLGACWHFALTGVEPEVPGEGPERFPMDPDWPEPLRSVLGRLLDPDPERRFGDDAERVRAIEQVLAVLEGEDEGEEGARGMRNALLLAVAAVIACVLLVWKALGPQEGASPDPSAFRAESGREAPPSPGRAAAQPGGAAVADRAAADPAASGAAEAPRVESSSETVGGLTEDRTAQSPPRRVLRARRLGVALVEELRQIEAEPTPEGGALALWGRIAELFEGELAAMDRRAQREDDSALRAEIDRAVAAAAPVALRLFARTFEPSGGLRICVARVPRIVHYALLVDPSQSGDRPFLVPVEPALLDEGWVPEVARSRMRPRLDFATKPTLDPTVRTLELLAERVGGRVPTRTEWIEGVAPWLVGRMGVLTTERFERIDWERETYGAGLVDGKPILRRWTGLPPERRVVRLVVPVPRR